MTTGWELRGGVRCRYALARDSGRLLESMKGSYLYNECGSAWEALQRRERWRRRAWPVLSGSRCRHGASIWNRSPMPPLPWLFKRLCDDVGQLGLGFHRSLAIDYPCILRYRLNVIQCRCWYAATERHETVILRCCLLLVAILNERETSFVDLSMHITNRMDRAPYHSRREVQSLETSVWDCPSAVGF